MRLFEIIVIIVLFIVSIQYFLPSAVGNVEKRTLMGWTAVANGVLIVVHLVIEGFHWQMLPVYVLAAGFFVRGIIRLRELTKTSTEPVSTSGKSAPRKRATYATIVLTIALIVSSAALDSLLPIFDLPDPTGEYQVGTVAFQLTDYSRAESFTEDPDDYRRILVRAWYPADAVSGLSPVPYITHPAEFGQGIQLSFGFPSFIVSHFPLVSTDSYWDVPIYSTDAPYPVLFFSHGYGGLEFQNTALMQELASNGYIIFSINHPYESAVAAFPDDTTVYQADEETLYRLNNSLNIWADDTRFLIDQLEMTNNADIPAIFWDSLDLVNIGVLGHSFGGTTAEELSLVDARVDAGVNLDGPHYGHSLVEDLTKPFMLMFGPDYGNPDLNDTVYQRSQNTCYGLFVSGTRHYNFADVSIWTAILKSFGLLGSIDGQRMLTILNRYVLAFFDKHLKGTDSTCLEGPSSEFPEIAFYLNGL